MKNSPNVANAEKEPSTPVNRVIGRGGREIMNSGEKENGSRRKMRKIARSSYR